MLEGEKEGDQAAEGRSTKGGVVRRRKSTELPIHERLEVVQHQLAVERATPSAELRVRDGCVLRHAIDAGVGDADEDYGFHAGDLGQAIGGGVGAPGVTREIGRGAVKEVLAVMQIEDREASIGFGKVGDGKIDGDAAVGGNRCTSQGAELVAGIVGEFRVQHGSPEEAGRSDRCQGGSARFGGGCLR